MFVIFITVRPVLAAACVRGAQPHGGRGGVRGRAAPRALSPRPPAAEWPPERAPARACAPSPRPCVRAARVCAPARATLTFASVRWYACETARCSKPAVEELCFQADLSLLSVPNKGCVYTKK